MLLRDSLIKILVLLLVLGQVLDFIHVKASAENEERPYADIENEIIDLGTPIQTAQTIDAVYGQENGVNVVYTTVTGSASSGDWAKFNVIDIDNEKLLGSYPLEGASNSWSHVRTLDGRVFIGASKKMFVYDPASRNVTDLGVPLAGTESIWSLTSDEKGNVFGGIYSASAGGRVFKIDSETLEISDVLGEPVDDLEDYIRSIGYYGGKVYAGTGSTNGRVWKIDPITKEKERLELPGPADDPVYNGKFDKMGAAYGITIVDHYLFVFFNGSLTLHVYDLEKQVWRDKILSNIRGLMAATGVRGGKVYTSKKDGNMWEIDIESLEERIIMPFDGSIRNSAWMNVKNQPEFGESAMVTISYDGKVVLYDPPNQKKKVMSPVVQGLPINLQAIESGPDGRIYVSGYMGAMGAVYDPANEDQLSHFPLGQAEGIGSVKDTLYFGGYPKAEIFRLNTKERIPEKGPSFAFEIGQEQDRPFVLREGAGKLLIGTIPGYSKHGGALTIFDPHESEISGKPEYEVYRNIVENQSVAGLAYKDGIIYGSTTIHGGLGEAPIASRAKLFSFDMKNREKLREWDLEIEGLSSTVPMISGLTVGPDGLVWGIANGFIFAFDTATQKVVKSKNVYPEVTNYGRWRPLKIYWGKDGLIYTNIGEKLTVLDPQTLESRMLADRVSIFTMNDKNDIYFAQSTHVMKRVAEKPSSIELVLPKSIYVNEKIDLKAKAELYGWDVDVSRNAVYEVSDSNTAKIENGRLIPLNAGEVTVTATLLGVSSIPIKIIIKEQEPIKSNLYVENASFERELDGDIPGWSAVKGKDSVIVTDELAVSGTRSLQLVNNEPNNLTEVQSDLIEIQSGRKYTAGTQVYIKSKNNNISHSFHETANISTLFEVVYYDQDKKVIREVEHHPGKTSIKRDEWFEVQFNGEAPRNAKYMRLKLKSSYGWVEKLLFDDVFLYTMAKPDELPEVEAELTASGDLPEGIDVTLSVKANRDAIIQVREAGSLVASGRGAGDDPVEIKIPAPDAGEHQYQVFATFPGIGTTKGNQLPKLTVHALSGIQFKDQQLDLALEEERSLEVIAVYGPITRDISTEAEYSSSDEGIVQTNRNVLKANKEGEASVRASYRGETAKVNIKVSPYQLQKIDLEIQAHILTVDKSFDVKVIGTYHNRHNGDIQTKEVSDRAVLTSSPGDFLNIEGMKISGILAGEAELQASFSGMQAIQKITVLNPGDPYKNFLDVENSQFEMNRNDGTIPGWSIRAEKQGYTSIGPSKEKSQSGETSIKLIDATTSGYSALQSNLLPIESGREYTAGASIYLANPPINPDTGSPFTSSRTLFKIQYYDANKQEINLAKTPGAAVDAARGIWHQAEISFVPPENAKYVSLLLSSSIAWVTQAYYDDAYLYTIERAE